MKTHYITALNPKTQQPIEFEFAARDSRHARSLFAQQYPDWKVKTCKTTAGMIGTIALGSLVTLSLVAVAIDHLTEPAQPSATEQAETRAE
jgi:hypothetical protein